MAYIYNEKYFVEGNLIQLRPKLIAINTYILRDGLIVAMFQGNRGMHPELDYKIKILRPGIDERPETPPHIYWVVDLMLKIEKYKKEVKEILSYYLDFYNSNFRFNIPDDRNNYRLQTVDYILDKYSHIEQENTLSIEYVAIVLELFCLCEKMNDGAYMFRNLLQILMDYIDGKADYMNVLSGSKPLH